MKKINTYEIKVDVARLRKAASETWDSWNTGVHVDVFYDPSDGDVWADTHVGNSWSVYHDPAIIQVACTERHLSAQAIMDRIKEELERLENEPEF